MAREAKASKQARAIAIYEALDAAYPASTCALDHASPFQLLVATVLSAQTTDVAVNRVTIDLFAKWPTPDALAGAGIAEVGQTINSIGLWRAKAKNIVGLSEKLVAEFGGELPLTVDELVTLPGVGRKTATAVLGTAFGLPAGITVDTHMLRINKLLRLSIREDPNKMAAELEQLLPTENWNHYTHLIIDHGRIVCPARRPRCGVCPLVQWCPSAESPKVGYAPRNDARLPASAKSASWLSRGLN